MAVLELKDGVAPFDFTTLDFPISVAKFALPVFFFFAVLWHEARDFSVVKLVPMYVKFVRHFVPKLLLCSLNSYLIQ